MMLSFSIPEMRPLIEAGLRERAVTGFPPSREGASADRAAAAGERVKRNSIRRRGPVWQRVLAESEGGPEKGGRVERDLHLWWKSRSPAREKLGTLRGFEIFPVTISRSNAVAPSFAEISMNGVSVAHEVEHRALTVYDQMLADAGGYAFAWRDGFDEWMDFVNFFVPRPGDRFAGALIRW